MGVAFNRADPDQVELMDLLNATPAISEKQGAASVAEALQSGMAAMKAHQDEPNVRLHGALGFAQTALPGDPRSLLISLGIYDHKRLFTTPDFVC